MAMKKIEGGRTVKPKAAPAYRGGKARAHSIRVQPGKADVGKAVGKAVGDAAWAANNAISAGLKSSPGLRSKGIENVMKLPAKRK